MKNVMKFATESGFVFNRASQQLEWFELETVRVNFCDETIEGKGLMNGVECTLCNDDFALYADKERWEIGYENYSEHKFEYLFYRVLGFYPIQCGNDWFAWVFDNGEPNKMRVESITFILDVKSQKWTIDTEWEFYYSREHALMHHDYRFVDKDGCTYETRSVKTMLSLNAEQTAQVEKLRDALQELNRLGVTIINDDENGNILAVPMADIDCLEKWDDYDEEYDNISNIATQFKYYIPRCCVSEHGLHAKFKESSRVVKIGIDK